MTIELGDLSSFGVGVLIHDTANVDTDCRFGHGVVIEQGVAVGARCVIQTGVVLGSAGFGYTRDSDGIWQPKPDKLPVDEYAVIVENDVHIGVSTCIDRGSWRATRIGTGTRIDNLVHIAHNVQIGRNVIIVAGAEVSGSVVIEDGAWIGPNACIKERVRIGRGALVGMGAVVLKDVKAHTTVAGNPARVINDKLGVRQEM